MKEIPELLTNSIQSPVIGIWFYIAEIHSYAPLLVDVHNAAMQKESISPSPVT